MHLTRKQTILIITLSGIAALLLVGFLIFWHYARKSDPIPAEPSLPPASATASPTDIPSPTPTPMETPSPTPYYLPLVPQGGAAVSPPMPSVVPTAPPTVEPQAEASRIHPSPREGVYQDQIKEFMAIGTQNGEAIAVLLVRVQPPETKIAAIPCETLASVYTLKNGAVVSDVNTAPLQSATTLAESEREGCWNLVWAVKNLTGYRAPAYLCVDFGCMEAFFSFVTKLPADGAGIDLDAFLRIVSEAGETRAKDLAGLGVGVVKYLREVSLWELPSFRAATRGSFTSSLSVFELLKLMNDLKKVESFSVSVLPTELKNGARVLSDAAVLPF